MVFQPWIAGSRYACVRSALLRAGRIIENSKLERLLGRGMRNAMEIATFGDVLLHGRPLREWAKGEAQALGGGE